MIYYFPLLIFPFVFIRSTYLRYILTCFLFLFMLLLAGLRWQTGTDWFPYYEDFISPNLRHDFEIGYVLYVNMIRFFTNNYTIFLLISTFVPLSIIFFTIRKFSKTGLYFLFSIFLFYGYYYLGSFLGAERRIFAIAMGFLSLYYYLNGRNFRYIVSIIIASCFHISASVLFLVMVINKFKIKTMMICIIVLIFLALFFQSNFIINNLILGAKLIPLDVIQQKIIHYLMNRESYGHLGYFGLLKRVAICVFLYSLYSYISESQKFIYGQLLKIYIVGVAVYTSGFIVGPMFSVLSIYFTITEIILIPIALLSTKLIKNNIYLLLIIMLYLIYQTYSILLSYPNLFYPYISILSGESRVGIL